MSTLRIQYFGWPQITKSSAEKLSVEKELSNKALALFIYLSIEQKEHSREILQTMFWRDSEPEKAASSLRVALNNINKHLANYITKNRRIVSFDQSSEFEIDIIQFLHTYKSFDSGSSDFKNKVSIIEQAVQLYGGLFLEGFYIVGSPSFEGWAKNLQESLSIKYQCLLQWLINSLMQLRKYTDALTYAQKGVELNPLNEEIHQKLMILYAKSGLRLAAIKQFQSCLNIFDEELGIRPNQSTEQLFERIRQLPKQKQRVPHHDGFFVGRSADKEEIKERLFNSECRLLTVVGLGGVGKTTLVSNFISEFFKENFIPWLEGYRFISLVNIHSEAQLNIETASALKLTLTQTEPIVQQIVQHLDQKEILLFFDNYDHLVQQTNLIEMILEKTTDVQIVVTSREKLSLKEEWVYELVGLPFPPLEATPQESIELEFDSIALFNHVANRTSRQFNSLHNRQAVVEFCRFVEGMPLAIELAASLVETKSLNVITQELRENLEQIKTKFKNVDSRHETLFSCFEYTWRYLNNEARDGFAAMVSFVAPFSEEAAQEVMQTSKTAIELLQKKSFLTQLQDKNYFKVHPLVLQFANMISGEEKRQEAKTRHQKYYLQLLVNDKNSLFQNQNYSIKVIELNLENIMEAIFNVLKSEELTCLPTGIENLGLYFEIKSSYLEGIDFLTKFLKQVGQVLRKSDEQANVVLLIEAVILMWLGIYAYRLGDKEKAAEHSNRSVSLIESLSSNYDRYKILSYLNLGNLCLETGDFESGRQFYQTGSQLGRELGFGWGVSASENLLGILAFLSDDLESATQHTEESVLWAQRFNDLWSLSFGLSSLTFIAYQQGLYPQAIKHALQNLEVAKQFDHQVGQSNALTYLGLAYSANGEFEQANFSLQQGLKVNSNENREMSIRMIFICIADLWKRMGKLGDTLQLLIVLEKYEVVGRPDFYQMHQTLLAEVTSLLPENEVANAKRVAVQKSLNDYLADFLSE